MEKLKEWKKWLEEKTGRKVVGVLVGGSWAMDLANETSDYDVHAWVVPTSRDLVSGEMFSKDYKYPLNEEVSFVVKDVRLAKSMFQKQNPSYLTLLNTELKWVDKNWTFMLDDGFRSYHPYRSFVASIKMTTSDMKKTNYAKEKRASRMWYTYDLAKYLAENKKYPKNCELEHAGEYLKVKNGQYDMLLETCQVETVNEALEYLNDKMEELFQMKPLSDEVDTVFREQFTKTFTKVFMNEVRLLEV